MSAYLGPKLPIPAGAPRRYTAAHYVYRLFNADGQLIYIGCSADVKRRIQAHRRKPWGSEIARVDIDGPFDGIEEGRGVEAIAIRDEAPKYNIAHRGIPGWMLAKRPAMTVDEARVVSDRIFGRVAS